MEPEGPAKNDDGSGYFKRRISSILKAPRKSARFQPDTEQRENTVECPIPVEKRNSRRVSFAPANDVLLFSKDAKTTSPTRNPLQELKTATGADTQNRTPVVVTEDGIQQMIAMENLLNAPLHAFQQQEKVSFDAVEGLGEKTVMFSTDEAFMDITHSQTINFASYADISFQNGDALPTGGEKTVMFSADDASMDLTLGQTLNMTNKLGSLPTGRNMDLSVEKRNISSPVPGLDPGFENFLASLCKPGGVSSVATVDANSSYAYNKAQTTHVDKENQLPTSLPAGMEKSLSTSQKAVGSSNGSVRCPEDDVSMNLTEVQTGRILGCTDSDDPFQFLFPTQDIYAQSDKSVSQTAEMTKTYSDPKDMMSMKNPSSNVSHPSGKVTFDIRDECREKTIMFTAHDDFMDMTQSHKANITLGPLAPFQPPGDSLDSGFKNFLTGFSKPTGPTANPVVHRMVPSTAASSRETMNMNSSLHHLKKTRDNVSRDNWMVNTSQSCGESSAASALFPETDVGMDITEAQTGHIIEIARSEDPFQFLFAKQDTFSHRQNLQKAEIPSGQKNNEVLGSSNHTVGGKTSLKPPLKTKLQRHQDTTEEDYGDKADEFSANDAYMDVTRSHTVNINTDFKLQSQQNLLPCRDKTIRFNVNDAGMDMTQCLTVNIVKSLGPESVLLPVTKQDTEKRDPPQVRSSAGHTLLSSVDPVIATMTPTDAQPSYSEDCGALSPEGDISMEMTEVQTGHIVGITHTDDPPRCRFPTQDMKPQTDHLQKAEMTSQLQSREESGSSQCKGMETSLKASLDCKEETLRLSAEDTAMNLTHCLTVNIASKPASDSVLPQWEPNIVSIHENTDFILSVKKSERNRSLPACGLNTRFKNPLFRKSGPWAIPEAAKVVASSTQCPLESVSTNSYSDQLSIQRPDLDNENLAPGFAPATIEKSQNETITDCPEINVSMDMTEARTGHIFGQACTGELSKWLISAQDPDSNSDLLKQTKATSQQRNQAQGSCSPDHVEITDSPESVDANEIVTRERPEAKKESSPSAFVQDADALRSRKSRRISLADLQSKARRLSQMINTAPDSLAVESCTTLICQLDTDVVKILEDKPKSLTAVEPELEMASGNIPDHMQNQCRPPGDVSAMTTPFNLKTKQLMSRLSVGGFKPKLPQRSNPSDPKMANHVGEQTRTINADVTNQTSNVDHDVSDIYDEELGSCEDMSETLDTRSPQKIAGKASHFQDISEPVEDNVFEEDFISAVHGIKRPLPEDENNIEDEKRMKASTDVDEMELESDLAGSDGNNTAAPNSTTHTTDCSSSTHTASSRCEATFESTFKQSLIESQLEDYTSDAQKKLDDGTITVLEFFKLFNIDFVIHNPRQSVLPGRLLSDTDLTPMDILKDRHISRPKQRVYEANVLDLTEKVEGLKVRMRDLDKPLRVVNKILWEEMRNSSEEELKSFGASLKERNNYFRKMSKAQSHEMKEVLYSNLIQTNLEEQQKLREKVEKADEMIKTLDDCISELEAELAAVEDKGFQDKPSLKSRQQEMRKVTEALADNERQMTELELQKKQNSSKLNRLKAETRNLETHVATLHVANEWRFGENKDNCAIYTFLHETMHLQLVYEKSERADAGDQCERKISQITFKLQLHDEKSQCHAHLVHRLLSQYIESETSWVEKYPTSGHVPKLLHNVGLVVSRCRLLGEELRLLKLWGCLKLDILHISCVDTQVHIVFSSLKKLSKFEVVFSISLIDHLCVIGVESYKNMIGGTEMQQIKEIVASFSPSKNLLTKIITRIHDNLLR